MPPGQTDRKTLRWVFVSRPPMPKLLSNSRIEPASVIHNMISVYRPIPSSCFFLFLLPERVPVFFLVLFFFVAAIFLTPLKVPAVCTYRHKITRYSSNSHNKTVNTEIPEFLSLYKPQHCLDTEVPRCSCKSCCCQIFPKHRKCDS